MKSWLEWRNWVGKLHKKQGWPQAWEYCQTKPIKTLGRASQGLDWSWSQCIKSHHAQTSSGKGTIFLFGPLLLSGPKSSFQMKVNFAFHLEIKVPESGGRVERHRIHVSSVQCEVSTVSDDLGCHVICWCWSTVFPEVHSQRRHLLGNFRARHASFCRQALWRCWFHFPTGLGTCPHCQRYQKLVQWPWCYCAWLASKLAWPEPHRESMEYCQEEDETPDPTMQMTWRPLSKRPVLPLHLSSATDWSPPCHAALRQ